MKKILAFLLVALTVAALFVIPASAADDKNFKVTLPGVKKGSASPIPDGVVKAGEYVTKTPIHSFSANRSQFNTEHDEYGDWDVDFYTCWDADNLYLAWVVHSDIQVGLPSERANGEGGLGNMWEYSCVQFILTPGAPDGTTKYQTAQWSGNYLECGLTLLDNREVAKIAWSAPIGLQKLDVNDWDGAIKRDDAAKTTTYEVRIPWTATGVQVKGDNAQFGLTYAVSAQEQYTSVKKGMLEWQDAILGGKNADNAAIMTLEAIGEEQTVIVPVEPQIAEGEVPAEVKDATCVALDGIDTAIAGEKAYLITKPTKENIASYNTKYALGMLLEPVEGKTNTYKLVEKVQGAGNDIEFATDITDGMILALIHSDGEGTGAARRDAAAAVEEGSELYLFGVDAANSKQLYSNAALYVTSAAVPVDESSEPESSAEESSEPESSMEETSAEESKVESAPVSSTAEEEEGGLSTIALVLIIIGAIIIIGAVVAVIIVKKKKK